MRGVKAGLANVVSALLSPFFASRVASRAAALDSVHDQVDFLFRVKWGAFHLRPWQQPLELRALLDTLVPLRPRRVLEIGTAKGGTLFLLCQVAHPEATIVSIDLPGGRFGGGYPEWRGRLYRSFAGPRQRIHLVRADSHAPETRDYVSRLVGLEGFDFIFIDADHRYEGVSCDYSLYSKLLSPDGLIGFHDITPGPERFVGGVPQFWREVREGRPSVGLRGGGAGRFGIGLLSESPRALRQAVAELNDKGWGMCAGLELDDRTETY